ARPEPEIELGTCALVVAGAAGRAVDEAAALDRLDGLADLVRIRLDTGDPEPTIIRRIHDVLYREVGFRGPTAADYGAPENSLLDLVLERRVGLPISLAIVELEVAWRIGVGLAGVGLPGHFIVGAPDGSLCDPADGGR